MHSRWVRVCALALCCIRLGHAEASNSAKNHRKRKHSHYTKTYRKQRDAWHEKDTTPRAMRTPPWPLILVSNHSSAQIELSPATELGGFDAEDLRMARAAFAPSPGVEHEIDPRLLNKLYWIQMHFDAPYIRIISGYRATRSTSRHALGRAADIVLPGVSDAELAQFARSLGFVGVGLYPLSGFVHVDVRAQSYFWVDRSPPGVKRKRAFSQFDAAAATAGDEAAKQRGEQPFVETATETEEDADTNP